MIKRDSVTKVADAHLVHRSDLRILWKSVVCGSDTNADSTLFSGRSRSTERLQKFIDDCVERGIVLAFVFDFSDGVNDGRVMLAAKALPDLGERGVGEVLTEIHGNLSWKSDRPGVVARLQVADLE